MSSSKLTIKNTDEPRLEDCLEDLRNAKTEVEFTLRETTIRLRHAYGAIINEYFPDGKDVTAYMPVLAKTAGTSERNLYYCLKFARLWPDVDGYIDTQAKNLSWRKVITKELTEKAEPEPRQEPDEEGTTVVMKEDVAIALPKADSKPSDLAKLYMTYTKEAQCITCFNPTGPPNHFPRTTGRGALPWEYIPMCGECHARYHKDPKMFWDTMLWVNRVNLFKHFYDFIQSVEVTK